MIATIYKLKNKRGCYDRYVVSYGGKDVAVYPISSNDRACEDAKTKAMNHARRINGGKESANQN